MSSYKCQYCKNEYSNNISLKTHQKTAKFCIKIQKELSDKQDNKSLEIRTFQCEYCEDEFNVKCNLERHYQTCKYKEIRHKEEEILRLKNIIEKNDECLTNMKEQNNKLIEELNNYKTEVRVKDEQLRMKDEQHEKELRMKDEINFELKREIETLKQESKEMYMTILDRSDKSYNTLIEHSDKTYNTFIEKEEKLVNTLLYQNNSNKNSKSVNNNLTINNYGIKPITAESVINAFESYNTKNPSAFNGYQYDGVTFERGSLKLEFVFYGIVKELRDYYGITDVSREKIVYNYNGELTLTTMQEFIRTNIVMNNIDAILEWIENLQVQIEERIIDGVIDIKGEERMMTEEEKSKLKDKKESLNYVYKIFKGSKDMGTASMYLIDTLREEAMKVGKVVGKTVTKQLPGRDLE